MSLPFYDRVSPRCARCQRRKHVNKFLKWYEGNFIQRPFCVECEASEPEPALYRPPPPPAAPMPPLSKHLRRKAWGATLTALRDAQLWCATTAQRASPAWCEFLDVYSALLQSIQRRIEDMRKWGNNAQPMDYFFSPETLRRLTELYAAADPQRDLPYGPPPFLPEVVGLRRFG